jgi:hypothetical protein
MGIIYLHYADQIAAASANLWNKTDKPVLFEAKVSTTNVCPSNTVTHKVFLLHYRPLENIMATQGIISVPEIQKWIVTSQGIPSTFQSQLISFHQELVRQGLGCNCNLLEIESQADIIVCCWPEFLEAPYKQKHVEAYLPLSPCKGSVFTHFNNPNYLMLQWFSSYSCE